MRRDNLCQQTLSKHALHKVWNGLAVIGVSRCNAEIYQLSEGVDDEVEFETKEPSYRRLTSFRETCKDLVVFEMCNPKLHYQYLRQKIGVS